MGCGGVRQAEDQGPACLHPCSLNIFGRGDQKTVTEKELNVRQNAAAIL